MQLPFLPKLTNDDVWIDRKAPATLVLHARGGACIGDMASYDYFTLGGPYRWAGPTFATPGLLSPPTTAPHPHSLNAIFKSNPQVCDHAIDPCTSYKTWLADMTGFTQTRSVCGYSLGELGATHTHTHTHTHTLYTHHPRPRSVRGYSHGELGASRRFLETAAEVRPGA